MMLEKAHATENTEFTENALVFSVNYALSVGELCGWLGVLA